MKRLKELRTRRRVTLKELGKAIGVRDSTISQYETGKNNPNLKRLMLIADYFGVTTDFLLGRTDVVLNSNTLKHYIENLEGSGNDLTMVSDYFDPYCVNEWLDEARELDDDKLQEKLMYYVDDAKNAMQGALSLLIDLRNSAGVKDDEED